MPSLDPVPITPLRDNPSQDSIWKRWLEGVRNWVVSSYIVAGGGSYASSSVVYYNGATSSFSGDTGLVYSNLTSSLTVAGDLAVNGSTLSITPSTWIYNSNWSATRALGAAAAGTVNLLQSNITYSGDVGGTTNLRGFTYNLTGSGANAITRGSALASFITHSGSALLTNADALLFAITSNGTGNIATARGATGSYTLNGGATTTIFDGFACGTPTITNGTVVTINGFRAVDIGAVRVTTAVAFKADNITNATNRRAFQASINASTNAYNFYGDGSASSLLAHDLTVCSLRVSSTILTVSTAAVSTLYVSSNAYVVSSFSANDISVSSGAITTTSTLARVYNTTAEHIEAFGAATTMILGGTVGTAQIRNQSTIMQAVYASSLQVSSLTSGRLALVSTAGLISNASQITYSNDSSDRGLFVTGSGSNTVAITATNTHSSGSASVGTEAQGTGDASLLAVSDSTGDAYLSLTAGIQWYAGIDNSVSGDPLVIGTTGTPGSNDRFILYSAGRIQTKTKIQPGTDAAGFQASTGIFAGGGAPNNANGSDGDFYFRSDGGALTTIYQRRAGAWVGIL